MSDSSQPHDPSVREKLAGMFMGGMVTQLVYVAAKLGIPDLLASAPMTVEELATRVGGNPRSLDGMLRALVALEVFATDVDNRFTLKPLGAMLKSSEWRSQAILFGEEYYRASSELLHTALRGQPAFDRALGGSFYEYFYLNTDAASRFNEVMIMSAPIRYADVPAAFDFSKARTIVDVGAGHGGLTSIILRANPAARAILFDAPQVIEGARRHIESKGLSARCDFVGGSFFGSVPTGGDAYLLAAVVVNWDDEHALTILRNCRAAMSPQADLVLIEYAFLGDRVHSAATFISAVAAHAIQGCRMRTEPEYRAMLAKAGFRIERITALAYPPYVLIHARPE